MSSNEGPGNKTKQHLEKERKQREKERARRDVESVKRRLASRANYKALASTNEKYREQRKAERARRASELTANAMSTVHEEKENALLSSTNDGVYLGETKSMWLIESYVKSLEHSSGLLVPKELNCVLMAFYYQFLPPYRIATNQIATVDEEQYVFSTNGTGWLGRLSYVIFDTPWMSGKHELRMQCIQDGGKAVGIGLVTNRNANTEHWLFDHKEGGLTYQVYSCRNSDSTPGIFRYRDGKEEHVQHIEKNMVNGMVISLQADFDKNTITYSFDGKQIGSPLSIEEGQVYYPAVAYNCGGKPYDEKTKKPSSCAAYRLLLCA